MNFDSIVQYRHFLHSIGLQIICYIKFYLHILYLFMPRKNSEQEEEEKKQEEVSCPREIDIIIK